MVLQNGREGAGQVLFYPYEKEGGGGAENVLVILIGAQKVTLPCCE